MADEVNSDAFDGGDTAPATKTAIAARNATLQTEADAINAAAVGDYAALVSAEEAAFLADPGLRTGEPITAQEAP